MMFWFVWLISTGLIYLVFTVVIPGWHVSGIPLSFYMDSFSWDAFIASAIFGFFVAFFFWSEANRKKNN